VALFVAVPSARFSSSDEAEADAITIAGGAVVLPVAPSIYSASIDGRSALPSWR
jgi:hypothetical protein